MNGGRGEGGAGEGGVMISESGREAGCNFQVENLHFNLAPPYFLYASRTFTYIYLYICTVYVNPFKYNADSFNFTFLTKQKKENGQ